MSGSLLPCCYYYISWPQAIFLTAVCEAKGGLRLFAASGVEDVSARMAAGGWLRDWWGRPFLRLFTNRERASKMELIGSLMTSEVIFVRFLLLLLLCLSLLGKSIVQFLIWRRHHSVSDAKIHAASYKN